MDFGPPVQSKAEAEDKESFSKKFGILYLSVLDRYLLY